MVSEKKMEVATAWTPREFKGTDLLPILSPVKVSDEPAEEVVGRENIDIAKDFLVPNLKLLQGISDEITQGAAGAKPGLFCLTSTGEIFEPPIRVLVVHHSKSRGLFPNPSRPNTNKLERCISRDGVSGTVYGDCAACPHKDWEGLQKDENPPCAESQNFVVLLPQGPAVIRFSRTSFKAARKFLTQVIVSGKNFWAHPAIIRAKPQQKMVGGKLATYFVAELSWEVPELVPVEYRKTARENFDQLKEAHEAGRLDTGEPTPEDDAGQ